MKKLSFLHLVFSILLVFSINWSYAEKPFYVYQNDGKINAFFTSDVDSIVLSKIDIDGTSHSSYVTQEFHAIDSIYRFSIECIDSVSFVTPTTVYKDNVVPLEGEIRKYIVGVDDMNLILKSEIPSSLCPTVGQLVVSTINDEYLLSTFLGKVTSITSQSNQYILECEPIEITDVFEVYYGFATDVIDSQGNSICQKQALSDGTINRVRIQPHPIEINVFEGLAQYPGEVSYEVNDNLAFSVQESQVQSMVRLSPVFNVTAFTIINPHYDAYVSVTIIGDYTLDERFYMGGHASVSLEKDLFELPLLRFPLVDVSLSGGLFMDVSLNITTDFNAQQKYRSVCHFDQSLRGEEAIRDVNTFFMTGSSFDGTYSLAGEFSMGIFATVGVEFVHTKNLDIAKVDAKEKCGFRLSGNFVASVADAQTASTSSFLYNKLKNSELSLDVFTSLDFEAQFFKWSWSHNIPWATANKEWNVFTWNALPKFKETKFINEEYPFSGQTIAYGNAPATRVGLALLDESKKDLHINYCSPFNDYTKDENGELLITSTFEDANESETYNLYPVVEYWGMDLLAEPSTEEQFVDLGLSVLWAKCNLGASYESEYGDYYSWGETSPKNTYFEKDWKYNNYYNRSDFVNAGIIDDRYNLNPEYDAATVNLGEDCRMPTYSEISELVNECTWSRSIEGGHKGFRVIGPNGNSIFLPAATETEEGIVPGGGVPPLQIEQGMYNSSTSSRSYSPNPYKIYFTYDDDDYWVNNVGRGHEGRPVRAVKTK